MKIGKEILSTLLIVASTLGSSGAIAQETTSIIAIGDDQWMGSVNLSMTSGPLRADAQNFRVFLNGASVAGAIAKAAQPQRIDENPNFYRERRGFGSPTLDVTVYFENGGSQTKTFQIAGSEDVEELIDIPYALSGVTVHVSGERTRYKCFDASTCVVDQRYRDNLSTQQDASFRYRMYDPILSCEQDSVIIEQKIANPTVQRAFIKDSGISSHLEISGVPEGSANQVGTAGFSTSLGTYGGSNESFRDAYFFQEYGGLKILVETKPYYWCHYSRLTSVHEEMSVPTRRGERCASFSESNWWVSGSSAGADNPYSRNWFFQSCRAVSE